MYDINTENVKKGRKIYYIFLVIGILFLLIIGGILISNHVKLNKLDSNVMSTRVIINSHMDGEGSILYSPTYYYRVNSDEYMCKSISSSSIRPSTSNKTVYYDSKNPANCMTEFSKSSNYILLVFLLIPIVFIIISINGIMKIKKRLKIIEELNKNGKLVKNLQYHMENTGIVVNGIPIQRPVIDYTLSSGTTITLYGEPRNDRKEFDSDGYVDLVIDENNPNNYFIDFEINRLTGNLPIDYYGNGQNNQNINNNYNNVNANMYNNSIYK